MGKAGFRRRHGLWIVVVVLLAVGLLSACTDNRGPAGPTHPAAQTGSTDGGVQFALSARPGPGADQFIVTLVLASNGGRPVAGIPVTMTGGKLNPSRGVTDANGEFASVLTCEGPFTVVALFEGAPDPPPSIPLCEAAATSTPTPTPTPTPSP